MADHDDGGPAFPAIESKDEFGCVVQKGAPGMSLRDWFAGQALAHVKDTAHEWELSKWFGKRGGITNEEIRAFKAYAVADAMIAARRQRQGGR
jgi:hypothetical protein